MKVPGGDYNDLQYRSATYSLDQAIKIDQSRNNGSAMKTLEELVADAEVIWNWMCGQYQPPPVATSSSNGPPLADKTARAVGYVHWYEAQEYLREGKV